MMKFTLVIVLFLSAFTWAKENPDPADFTINVHVTRSRSRIGTIAGQKLNVMINGRKYEIEAYNTAEMLLALGDYKARLVKDEHRGGYDSRQTYEFLLPDQRTRRFDVVGEME